MVRVEVKLSDWLYRAVTNLEVLTLHRDYFRLDGGIERRLYELCRKHCGAQPTWSIGLELLYKKSGSKEPLRNFQIPSDLVVKSQATAIIDLLLQLIRHPNGVRRSCHHKKSRGCGALNICNPVGYH